MMDVRTCAGGICGVLRVCPVGLRSNLFFFYTQHQSLLPVEAQMSGWTGSVSLSPTVRPPRTSGGGVDMSVCGCVCECERRVRVLKGLCSGVLLVFFVCFSVGRGLSQIVIRCSGCSVTTSTTAVSGQVWSVGHVIRCAITMV